MKFKFKGYELDTDVQYITANGNLLKVYAPNMRGDFSAASIGSGSFLMLHVNSSADAEFVSQLRPITIHDPIKKEPEYELWKYYLFSDDGIGWVADTLVKVDCSDEPKYFTRYTSWKHIKPIPEDMIGKII